MKFTDSHEWVEVENGIGTVGITEHARNELGEIAFVELPKVGEFLKAGQEAAVIESTKAAADIYSPVSGEVVEVNEDSQSKWLFKIKLSSISELDSLLTKEQYDALLIGAIKR